MTGTGNIELTNEFGQEVDEQDFGIVDLEEQQEILQHQREQQILQRRLQFEAGLAREFNLNRHRFADPANPAGNVQQQAFF